MTQQLLNEAFLVKITIIFFKFLRVIVNTYMLIFWGLDAHSGRNYEQTHTHTCRTTTVTIIIKII